MSAIVRSGDEAPQQNCLFAQGASSSIRFSTSPGDSKRNVYPPTNVGPSCKFPSLWSDSDPQLSLGVTLCPFGIFPGISFHISIASVLAKLLLVPFVFLILIFPLWVFRLSFSPQSFCLFWETSGNFPVPWVLVLVWGSVNLLLSTRITRAFRVHAESTSQNQSSLKLLASFNNILISASQHSVLSFPLVYFFAPCSQGFQEGNFFTSWTLFVVVFPRGGFLFGPFVERLVVLVDLHLLFLILSFAALFSPLFLFRTTNSRFRGTTSPLPVSALIPPPIVFAVRSHSLGLMVFILCFLLSHTF